MTTTVSPRVVSTLLAVLLAGAAAACADTGPAATYLTTPGGGGQYVKDSMALGEARLRPEVCDGVAENKPEKTTLDERALASFLQRAGFQTTATRERPDLVYLDVTNSGGDKPVRLRVAVLADSHAAAADLHKAILEHGSGSWGVHRGNLAVLGPIGSVDQIVEFAGRSKLACWGVLTVAGRDDDFVIPGGYLEF
jgi:hypothetical protein